MSEFEIVDKPIRTPGKLTRLLAAILAVAGQAAVAVPAGYLRAHSVRANLPKLLPAGCGAIHVAEQKDGSLIVWMDAPPPKDAAP